MHALQEGIGRRLVGRLGMPVERLGGLLRGGLVVAVDRRLNRLRKSLDYDGYIPSASLAKFEPKLSRMHSALGALADLDAVSFPVEYMQLLSKSADGRHGIRFQVQVLNRAISDNGIPFNLGRELVESLQKIRLKANNRRIR